MARWLSKALIPLAALLLLVLAGHGVALWLIGQELQAAASVITAQVDPLFTRQITQQSATMLPAEAPKPPKLEPNRPVAQVNTAQAAPKSVVSKVTQTAPITLPEEPTESAVVSSTSTSTSTATSSVAEATPSMATGLSETVAMQASVTATIAATASPTMPDASASLALNGDWPSDTRLTYELGGYFRGELHGNAQVQWTRLTPPQASLTTVATPGERYQVRIDMNIGPIDVEFVSQGRISATGLQPEVYEELLPRGRFKLKVGPRDIVLNDGRRVPRPDVLTDTSMALGSGPVQDTASQFVELGQRFSTGRARLAPGETLRVWLARPGGVDEWTYDVGQLETLYLPTLGAVQAYGLTPRPLANPRGTITAQMWFAPSLQNLPVRIKINLNSETHVNLMVKKIEQR